MAACAGAQMQMAERTKIADKLLILPIFILPFAGTVAMQAQKAKFSRPMMMRPLFFSSLPANLARILLLVVLASGAACAAENVEGAAVFSQNCASCHAAGSSTPRAPSPEMLKLLKPEFVLDTLRSGVMRVQAMRLDKQLRGFRRVQGTQVRLDRIEGAGRAPS